MEAVAERMSGMSWLQNDRLWRLWEVISLLKSSWMCWFSLASSSLEDDGAEYLQLEGEQGSGKPVEKA